MKYVSIFKAATMFTEEVTSLWAAAQSTAFVRIIGEVEVGHKSDISK